MGKVLIQANNLDTVMDVIMYDFQYQVYGKQDIADYCDFSVRQVDYCSNASKYLELIKEDWSLTFLAKDIFKYYPAEVTERVYKRIVEDELIGQIYKHLLDSQDEDISSYAKERVMNHYQGLSDSVYERRSDNMVKWCQIINITTINKL